MTKVLIHVPIFNNCPQFWESFWKLDIEGLEVDYFFTKTDKVKTRLDDKGNYDARDVGVNLPWKMEKARKAALEGGYDYLFNIEDDHIIPSDALKKLLSFGKDVISGVYRLRPSKFPAKPIAATKTDRKSWVTVEDLEKTPLLECHLVPWGCLLLSRRVLESVSFEGALDGLFVDRLDKAGFKRWLATEVRLGHIDRDGTIIWV